MGDAGNPAVTAAGLYRPADRFERIPPGYPCASCLPWLNASIATGSAGFAASGSFTSLAPTATNNSSLQVSFNGTGTAGAKTGTATVTLVSDGTFNGGTTTPLTSQVVTMNAGVYNMAAGSTAPSPVTIANQRVNGIGSQLLTISNTAAAGNFSEALNASFSATTAGITSNGSVSNVAANGANNTGMSVGVDTTIAGAKVGSVTIAYQTDGTGPNGNSGLAAISAGSQTINVSGNVYQIAQPTGLPANVNLGNFRAGTAQSQTVTLTNTNTAPAGFQEGLNASIVGTTGAGTGSGALNNVAAGASGNLQIGVTGVAGANTGSVQVQLATNGTGTSGLGNLNLGGAQTVTVSGTGWRLASANTQPTTINFGNVLVNSVQAQFLNIQNTAVADGFSERLDARFLAGGTTGAATNNGGSIGLLVAGTSNNTAMSVGVSTATIGAKTGQVIVAFDSNGSGTSGLGITGLANQNIGILANVAANVGTLAQPSAVTPNPVNFGNFRVGAAGAGPQNLTISNLATIGEGLNASIASGSAGFAASGSFTSLAPTATNNSSLQVSFNGTGTAGAKTGTATVTLVSDGTFNGGTTTALPAQTVNMSASVFRLANPTLNTPSVDLVARVGDTSPSAQVGVTNTSPDAFTERLNGAFGSVAPGFVGSGAVDGLNAGASNSALALSMNTTSAGSFTGAASVNFVSSGVGTTGAADAALASQQVALSGRVYTPAVGQLNTTVVDFGIVHKGDVVSARSVSVANAAAVAAPNDVLRGNLGGAAGPFTGSGSLAGVAAQATDTSSLSVALDTAAAGVFNGSAAASFSSHNAEMADLALPGATVALKAQVNNFAELALGKVGGDGELSSAASSYTLDFGTIVLGSTERAAELGVSNMATGPAALLNGTFTFAAGSGFSFTGFNPFVDIAAGSSLGGFGIVFDSASLGTFSQTITVSSFGTNASGFEGTVFDTTLTLRGSVTGVAAIPEPQTYALMIGGLLAIWAARRRQQRRQAA